MNRTFEKSAASSRPDSFKILGYAVVFLIIASLVALGIIFMEKRNAENAGYAKTLQLKIDASKAKFNRFFTPVRQDLGTIRQWIASGALDLDDTEATNALLIPFLDSKTQISALLIGRVGGWSHILIRTENGWANKHILEPGRRPMDTEWFREAINNAAAREFQWSDPYRLPGNLENGITATIVLADDKRSENTVVIAFRIQKQRLDDLAASVPSTERGILVLLENDQSIIWLSTRAGMLDIRNPKKSVIAKSIVRWGQQDHSLGKPFKFKDAKTEWWGAFYAVSETLDAPVIGLLVPSSELSERLDSVADALILSFVGLMALAVAVIAKLAYDYRRKLRKLASRKRHEIDSEGDLKKLIRAGENKTLEFKSTLRWNLKSNKTGKEIEQAWLKSVVAYLNSDGGILLIGVQDDGSVLGIEADQFASDDKFLLHFNNLIKSHIGLEFAKYLHGRISELDGKKIFVIVCEPAKEPVFLKTGENEDFYIRVGPSSRKLPTSKIMEYITDRPAQSIH